jgi:tripartite ATP-independent transporter DctP family solute receptor
MLSDDKLSPVSRRAFLKTAGLVGSLLAVWPPLLEACGSTPSATSAGTYKAQTFRLGHVFAEADPWAKACNQFAQIVASKSKNQVQVNIYPNSQLGSEQQLEEDLKLGALDLAFGGPGVLANFDPKIGIFDMPYLFTDYAHANTVLNGSMGQNVWDSMRQKANIRVLAAGVQGFRYVLTRSRVVSALADMKGVKIRVPDAPNYIKTFQLLGANPVATAFSTVYTSLQTGALEAAEGVPSIFISSKLYEPAKHVAKTSHICATLEFLVSEIVYGRMDSDTKKLITDAARQAWSDAGQVAQKGNQDAETQLQGLGVSFTSPDLAPFRTAVQPWLQEWGNANGTSDWIAQIQKL